MINKSNIFLLTLLVLLLQTVPTFAHSESEFDEIVVFGESSSDTGNVAIAQCPPKKKWGAWAPCSDIYYDGNLTNGRIWVEFLAKRLHVPRPKPSLDGGTNYAHGGAKTANAFNQRINLLTGEAFKGTEVPGVLMQVFQYLDDEGEFDKDQLVVIWGGANDLRDAPDDPAAIPGFIGGIISNLVTAVGTAACAGAEHIVVPNWLNASIAPVIQAPGGPEPGPVKALIIALNGALKNALDNLPNDPSCVSDAKIYQVDMYTVGETLVNSSKLLGVPYKNVTEPAVDVVASIMQNTYVLKEGVDPNKHLFLDTIHVTTPAQRIFADAAYHAIKHSKESDDDD